MCQYGRFIYNKYLGQRVYVECGHCEACLQKKANKRASRIRNECKGTDKTCFFITLDYENEFIPYIRRNELEEFCKDSDKLEFCDSVKLNVYRQGKVLKSLGWKDFVKRGERPHFSSYVSVSQMRKFKLLYNSVSNHTFQFPSDSIGVAWLDDVQRFFKRLRITLMRKGYTGFLSYYYCFEYGDKRRRPHIHILLYFDKGYNTFIKCVLDSCWPYANLLKSRRQRNGGRRFPIEVAKDPSSYVASYLSKSASLPLLLSVSKPFKVCSHFSNGFGFDYSQFSLVSLIKKIYSGSLRYYTAKVSGSGYTLSELRIPFYVLNRYFPKFKGFRYLSSDALVDYVENPARLHRYSYEERSAIRRDFPLYTFNNNDIWCLFKVLDDDELLQLSLRLDRLRKSIPPYLVFDWLWCYSRVWQLFASENIKDSYSDCVFDVDFKEHYNNIKEYYNEKIAAFSNLPSIGLLSSECNFQKANNFYRVKYNDDLLLKQYNYNLTNHILKSEFYEK